MKRKGTSVSDSPKGTKRRKNEGNPEENGDVNSKLDFSTPTDLLKTLLAPTEEEEFAKTYWEKQPFHLKRNDHEHYGNLFSLSSLLSILKVHKLNFIVDVNVCKYVDGVKEMLNQDGRATADKVDKLMKKQNATVQFHQPQRFSDLLWQTMEQLEKYFGSHVGANVYITPPKSQGLAPHHDDIEAFVLQLEGKKNWKLYKPSIELSKDYSADLREDEIGEPTHDITLEPGDLLYFPRGTIHQATTVGDSHSTHITLSTYQNNTWGDFLSIGLPHAIEIALSKDVEFRRGLPINTVSHMGTGKNLDEYIEYDEKENDKDDKNADASDNKTVKEFKAVLKNLLCRLVDHIDPHTVIDSMSEDFMACRLPPFKKEKDEGTENIVEKAVENISRYLPYLRRSDIKQPTAGSKIKVLYPDHMRLVVYEEEGDGDSSIGDEESDDEDEDEEEEELTEESEEEEKPAKKGKGKNAKEKQSTKSKKKTEEIEEGKPWPIKGKKKSYPKRKKSEEEQDEKQADNGTDEEMEAIPSEDEAENEGEGPFIKILHSVQNERENHMLGIPKEPTGIKLPLHFGKAVSLLMDKSDQYTPLKDLPLKEDEQLLLVMTLWSDKLIDVIES